MTITALPTPPTRDDPVNFASRADAFLSALPTFANEVNSDLSVIADNFSDVQTVSDNIANINAAVADLPALSAKVSKTGDTMSGPLSVPAGAAGTQVPRAQEIGTLANAQLTTHYKRSNILGTVSQSGGVPTGAIIETGSNANGTYIRWANGTQICHHAFATVANGTTWTFPAAFASPAITLANETDSTSAARFYLASLGITFTFIRARDATVVNYSDGNCAAIAIGRWF